MTDAHVIIVRKVASTMRRQMPAWVDYLDLVHEGVVAVLAGESTFRGDRGVPFEFWVVRTAKMAMWNFLRRARRHEPLPLLVNHPNCGQPPTQERACEAAFVRPHLRRALRELTDYRARVVLDYHRGVQMRHIAKARGVGPTAVSIAYQKALVDLRLELGGTREPPHYRLTSNARYDRARRVRRRGVGPERDQPVPCVGDDGSA